MQTQVETPLPTEAGSMAEVVKYILERAHDWHGMFNVRQDESDGSIRSGSITVIIRGRTYDHYRPLNSREPWPLWLRQRSDPDAEDFCAFTDDGELSAELLALIGA